MLTNKAVFIGKLHIIYQGRFTVVTNVYELKPHKRWAVVGCHFYCRNQIDGLLRVICGPVNSDVFRKCN